MIPALSLKTFIPLGRLVFAKAIILTYYSVKTVFSYLILFHLLYLSLLAPVTTLLVSVYLRDSISVFSSLSLYYVSKRICIKSLSSWKYLYILKRKIKKTSHAPLAFKR